MQNFIGNHDLAAGNRMVKCTAVPVAARQKGAYQSIDIEDKQFSLLHGATRPIFPG